MPSPLAGLVAGLAATVPMTVAMELMHRRLPRRERYPLPPRRITDELAASAGVDHHLDEPTRRQLALLNHFAYGAAVGAAYAPLARHVPMNRVASGVLYGLGVWTVSYLGWLPAAGILPSATRHPARRNALMIGAHVVWGAATGYVTEYLEGQPPRNAFAQRGSRSGRNARGHRSTRMDTDQSREAADQRR